MKKLVMFLGVLALMVVFSASQTGAALLGISNYQDMRPNVMFDHETTINYDAKKNTLIMTGFDVQIELRDGTVWGLYPYVGFGIAIKVDDSGHLTGGYTPYTWTWETYSYSQQKKITYSYTSDEYDMVEVVAFVPSEIYGGNINYVQVDGKKYYKGDVLLRADVKGFGWDETNYGIFDWLFDENLGGEWVDDGIWPAAPPLSGAYLTEATTDWKGDWTKNFQVTSVKGDKVPTPEPSSLLLLGSGLLGFGAFFRARFGRKKKD